MSEYMIIPKDSLDSTADAIRSKINMFENLDYSDLALNGTSADSVTSADIEFTNPLVVGEEYTITASFNRDGKGRNNSIAGTFTFSSYPIVIPSGITVLSGSWDSRDALSIYETYINGPHYTDEDWTFVISVKIEKKDQTLIWGQDGFADYVASIPSGIEGLAVKDCIEGKVTGNIVLNIIDAPPGDWYTCYTGLFRNSKISSLTVNGLLHVPGYIADQQGVGSNGNQSVLTSVSFPDAIYGGQNGRQFHYAKSLVSASLPSLTTTYYNYTALADYMFGFCSSLTSVDIGNANRICTYMFRDCTSLAFLELKAVDYIQDYAFSGASSLATIVIRSNAVPTLANIRAFNNTPFASGKSGGTLYVPSSLFSSYQSASNWSTILGYATNSIVAIEGSVYDT